MKFLPDHNQDQYAIGFVLSFFSSLPINQYYLKT